MARSKPNYANYVLASFNCSRQEEHHSPTAAIVIAVNLTQFVRLFSETEKLFLYPYSNKMETTFFAARQPSCAKHRGKTKGEVGNAQLKY